MAPSRPRLAGLGPEARERNYPPLPDGFHHLVEWVQEAGGCHIGEWGATGLTWPDLRAWSVLTGTPLDTWTATALHRLSADYAAGINAARDPECPAPWPQRDTAGGRRRGARLSSSALAHLRKAE